MQTKNQSNLNENYEFLQTKVFTRWVSSQLNHYPNSNIQDISKDLSNGVALIELAEVLTHKRPGRLWDRNPMSKIQSIQNCDLAINMFSNDGVKLVGITGKDISDNNKKLILGLIWSLISHYSVEQSMIVDDNKVNSNEKKSNESELKAQDELFAWAINKTKSYNGVFAFHPYDLAMCALLDSFYPEKINFSKLNVNDHEKNAKLAYNVMKEVGITCFVYPEDLTKSGNVVDKMTLLTQLAYCKAVVDNQTKSNLKENGENKIFETEEEARIKKEDAAIRKELNKAKEARMKEEKEEKQKIEKEKKEREIEEARHELERILSEKKEEQRIKNEQAIVKAENEKYERNEEEKELEDIECQEIVYTPEKKQEDIISVPASVFEQIMKREADYHAKADEEARLKDEAEIRAQKSEEKIKELEKKLKESEDARKKLEHKNNHINVKLHIHKNEDEENENHTPKHYNVGITVKKHDKNPNVHYVCKNLKVTATKDGKIVPTEIDRPTENDDQVVHVKVE